MVNAQVSHHCLDGRIVGFQDFGQGFMDGFVRDNEGCFVAIDQKPCSLEVVA